MWSTTDCSSTQYCIRNLQAPLVLMMSALERPTIGELRTGDAHGLREADPTVHKLRGLLSASDVATLHAAAAELSSQTPLSYDNTLRTMDTDEMPFGLHAPHESVFMHRDGYAARSVASAAVTTVVSALRRIACARQGTQQRQLGVRTIEYHTYRVGGGLLDPDHCDMGSVLTLSCLLSDPGEVSGGEFVTFDAQRSPSTHGDLALGDAIVFDSELRHNVQPILKGVRHSLVVEVWEGKDNEHDRHT